MCTKFISVKNRSGRKQGIDAKKIKWNKKLFGCLQYSNESAGEEDKTRVGRIAKKRKKREDGVRKKGRDE